MIGLHLPQQKLLLLLTKKYIDSFAYTLKQRRQNNSIFPSLCKCLAFSCPPPAVAASSGPQLPKKEARKTERRWKEAMVDVRTACVYWGLFWWLLAPGYGSLSGSASHTYSFQRGSLFNIKITAESKWCRRLCERMCESFLFCAAGNLKTRHLFHCVSDVRVHVCVRAYACLCGLLKNDNTD